jgi:hypothetical protein
MFAMPFQKRYILSLLFQRQQFCHLGFESGIFFSQLLQFFFLATLYRELPHHH